MHILLLSIHGLIRGRDLELGRDPDTGGQTKYVLDLTLALAARPEVSQVDLVTRRILDPAVSPDYGVPVEPLTDKARILRIDAGPEQYLAKERLWDHLDSFMDNLVRTLNGEGRLPDLIHSHYADAGYVGVRLSNLLGKPLVHTGHSLGRDKRQRLLEAGLSEAEIDQRYHMDRRVDAEEEVLAVADMVIASTHNEIEEQYGLYDYYQPERMRVIPPGTDLGRFHPPASRGRRESGSFPLAEDVRRFLREPDKPLILALSRADPRKNIQALLEAYGESRELRQAANLLIVAGNRDDIRDLDEGPQSVLTDLLILIDAFDLHGQVALPKHHRADEVPAIYRLAARGGGVFINPALTEPFGLTLLEAAASGLPLVATENGGPVDIIGNCGNGILVNPLDREAMAAAILALLQDPKTYRRLRDQGLAGVRRHYSWEAHAEAYLAAVRPLPKRHVSLPVAPKRGQRVVDDVRSGEFGLALGEDARDINRDIAHPDGSGRPHTGERLRPRIRVPGVPRDELPRRGRPRQVLPCDPELHVLTGPHGIHDRVVGGEQFLAGRVRAELHVPEEPHPRLLEGLRERRRHRLDARVIRRNAITQQAIGRRQPIDDIDGDRHLLLRQQGLRGE